MGAAGLVSSGAEMAGRSGTGVEIDVSRVPVREPGMTPYEILLSESQERMLVVARAGRENTVRAILAKWELEAAVVGRVTDTGAFTVLEDGVVVAEIPARPLTEECPTYERPGEESPEAKARRAMDLSRWTEPPGRSFRGRRKRGRRPARRRRGRGPKLRAGASPGGCVPFGRGGAQRGVEAVGCTSSTTRRCGEPRRPVPEATRGSSAFRAPTEAWLPRPTATAATRGSTPAPARWGPWPRPPATWRARARFPWR